MSWYDADWQVRRAIAVDNSASAGTTSDVSITIDPDDGEFWSAIRSDGADLRVTFANGTTLVTFKRSTFTYADRVLVIHCDDVTVEASAVTQLWVYVGYQGAGTPTDLVSTFVTGSTLTGRPFIAEPNQRIARVRPQRPDDPRPMERFSKLSSEETYTFFDFSEALLKRKAPYEGRLLYEEIDSVLVAELQAGGAQYAAGSDLAKTRLVDGGVALFMESGVSGTTYTAVCKVKTTRDRILEHRALVKVRNVSEQ